MDGSGFVTATPIDSSELESPLETITSADESRNPFGQAPRVSPRLKQIWAIGGGKGGIGKSMVASSLAITLARLGNKVTAVDLDLGGANLHTTLGVELPKQSLSDFFSGRTANLEHCALPTAMPHLHLISGAQDSVGVANLKYEKKVHLLSHLRALDTDYIILDLGAGTSLNTIDFFLFADVGIITLLPEPTSIENAYRFIKTSYYRRLLLSPELAPVRALVELALDSKNTKGIKSPSDLYNEINRTYPECADQMKAAIERFKPKLLINQARTQTDVDIGFSVKMVCKKYFGMEMDYLGYLDYDSLVWQAVRRKRPVMLEFPNSRLVSSIERVVQHLIKKHSEERSGF